ncbi:MAG: hypothetical protein PHH77_07235 [Victivallaceae bacterium]|nr:hypothetical protein [Victivallaceae bacterium]
MRKNELSVSQWKLLELMRQVGYGRINNLMVEKGDPVISPESSIERDLKLDAEDIRIKTADDSPLKKKTIKCFDQLGKIKDGFIRKIEIRGGLPIQIQTIEKIII